jgi:hypothetical protein
LKHASHDLPKDTVAELESQYGVSPPDNFNGKLKEVKAMANIASRFAFGRYSPRDAPNACFARQQDLRAVFLIRQ